MGDFDKTKKAIGLNNIDESSRKNLFEKFKSAGGKIIEDKSSSKDSDSKRQRPSPKIIQSQTSKKEQERSSGRGSSSGSSSKSSSSKVAEVQSQKTAINPQLAYEKELSSFPNRLILNLKCWFARVTPFGSKMATPSVMGIFSRELRAALLEMRHSGNELLTHSNYSPKICKELDKINPLYVEVLVHAHKIFNDSELEELLHPYNAAPDAPVPLEKIKNPLYSLFRKLYLMYPFQDSYRKAVNLAYEHLQKLEGKPALIYNTRKKKLLNEIDNLFGVIFEKMYLLVARNENKNIPMICRYMEQVLNIQPEDKLGKRNAGEDVVDSNDKAQIEEKKEKEEKQEKQEKAELPKDIAYGIKLMQLNSIEKLRKKFDPKGDLNFIPDNDKALLTYLFFKEFDDSYSFVMTTKKIVLKQIHVNGTRVDYRQKLLDQYETSRSILEQFRIYLDTYREYNEHISNPGQNYIEASKKKQGLENKRSAHSRNVRAITKDFMQKTAAILQDLIQDMKTKKEIVDNMDENFQFDAVEVKKRLNNKPVKVCITDCYCYCKAFADRLESGDLYGGVLELTPEQMKESFGIDIKSPEVDANQEEIPSSLEKAQGTSLDENQNINTEDFDNPLDSDSMGVKL